MKLFENRKGGYRFLEGIAPYSSGVVAAAGHEIVRVTLHRPVPYQHGFEIADEYLATEGLPRQALCAAELRCPEPATFDGFSAFNTDYQEIIAKWDLLVDGHNPVARTNVAPIVTPPADNSMHAFCVARPSKTEAKTFVVAGAGELEDQGLEKRVIVREGETSAEAMQEKSTHVMKVMRRRLTALGMGFADVTRFNLYTLHALESAVPAAVMLALTDAGMCEVSWHLSRPPIAGLEFEMDLHAHSTEIRLC